MFRWILNNYGGRQNVTTRMLIVILILIIFSSSSALLLPEYFLKCCLKDLFLSECITRSAIRAKGYITKGVHEINLPPLYPLVVPVSEEAKNDTNLPARLKQLSFYGMQNYGIDYLEFYPQIVLLKGKLLFKEVFAQALYDINKTNLVNLPNVENAAFGGILGPFNVTFDLQGTLIDEDNEQFVKLNKVKIAIQVNKYKHQVLASANKGNFNEVSSSLDIFVGRFNEVLDKNGEFIVNGIIPSLEEIFENSLKKFLNSFLSKLPYSKLFPCSA